MNKSDLNYGNVVELRNRERYLYFRHRFVVYFINLDGSGFGNINDDSYNYDLTCIENNNSDIMKVYKDYTLKELLWKRKEPIKLSKDEKVILRNIDKTRNDKNYKYIARLKSGTLAIFKSKPEKFSDEWFSYGGIIFPYSHLFQFIKWEDEEPYSIEELLREEVGE